MTAMITLEQALEALGLPRRASRKEIRAAYRRLARRWHPDRAPAREEDAHRQRMQQINAAYQVVLKFIEDYVYDLVTDAPGDDYQEWWTSRFYTGVWGPPPRRERPDSEDA